MAKQSGLSSSLFVGQYDISGDVGALSNVETSRTEQENQSIQDAAMARIMLLRDGAMTYNSFWNTVAGQSVPVLTGIARADVITSLFINSTIGGAAASMTAKNVSFASVRGQDGTLGIATQAMANGYGLEWSGGGDGSGMLTTGLQSFATGTVSGTSIDYGATSTLFGAAAYLHCTVMPSGTLTVTIEDSANNSTFSTVSGMVFTNLTGPGSERIQGAVNATVRRYVRVTCSGTHGTASVAVNFVRYLVSPAT